MNGQNPWSYEAAQLSNTPMSGNSLISLFISEFLPPHTYMLDAAKGTLTSERPLDAAQ